VRAPGCCWSPWWGRYRRHRRRARGRRYMPSYRRCPRHDGSRFGGGRAGGRKNPSRRDLDPPDRFCGWPPRLLFRVPPGLIVVCRPRPSWCALSRRSTRYSCRARWPRNHGWMNRARARCQVRSCARPRRSPKYSCRARSPRNHDCARRNRERLVARSCLRRRCRRSSDWTANRRPRNHTWTSNANFNC
jgi:hypothetical protein